MSHHIWRRRATRCAVAGLLAPALGVALAAPAAAAPASLSSEQLRDAVTVEGVMEHLEAFEDIAERNPVNGIPVRASGTPGYDASVAYVVERLEAAGYKPQVQTFEFPFFEETGPATLAVGGTTFVQGTDYEVMEYSPSGEVTGDIVPVDLQLTNPAASTSGCEASDFTGFPDGGVALVQRGTCFFSDKAANAEAAGASAVIVFNQGTVDRVGLFVGTLGGPGTTIPVVTTTFDIGQQLATQAGSTATVVTQTRSEILTTSNVIAETTGRTSEVVLAGAHLDSSLDGPAINDDGSGSAALLEIAEKLAGTQTHNKVRFAWFGAEENGLVGSEYYVANLTAGQLRQIAVMLNFDMLGSNNFARFYYDVVSDEGDATGEPATDAANDAVQNVFSSYFANQGLVAEGNETNLAAASSDYGPFGLAGVPVGGLFTGAGDIKSEDQATAYGGEAGVAFDPYYHTVDDTVANINRVALDEMTDAAAHAIVTFAYDTTMLGTGARTPGKSHEITTGASRD